MAVYAVLCSLWWVCGPGVVVTVQCFTPGHFFGVCLWVLELGHLGWAWLASNTSSLKPFWCLSVWHSSPVVLFGMYRHVHPQQSCGYMVIGLGQFPFPGCLDTSVCRAVECRRSGNFPVKSVSSALLAQPSDPMSSCFVPGARSDGVWIVQLCQPNKWMCIHTSTFLWSVLCAHLVRSAYLTLERALESFSKFWYSLQLLTVGLVCSCATKHKCNQHSFVWQTEMWRGVRGNQEDSHE